MNTAEPVPLPEQARGVSVEEIVSGTRCSPLTLKEFEAFLIHEEHSVENLQFTVWYRDYCKRFDALPAANRALSSPPAERYNHFNTPAASIRTAASVLGKDKEPSWWEKVTRPRSVSVSSASALNGFEMSETREKDDDEISLRAAAVDRDAPLPPSASPFPTVFKARPIKVNDSDGASTINMDSRSIMSESKPSRFPSLRFANLAPILSRSERELPEGTPLPYVDEIALVLTTFFLPGSQRELNIDARLRKHILKSLRPTLEDGTTGPPVTTHPDVFKEAAEHTFELMERSLPHYMQFAKGNTNTAKVLFWYGVGFIDFMLGVMIALICIFYAGNRGYRFFSFLFIWFGTMQAYSASRYFCSQVHGRSARQLYPWELTSELVAEEGGNPSAPTFTVAIKPGQQSSPKMDDLAASMPFLFEQPPAVPEKDGKKVEKKKAVYRGKWFASLRRENGKRVPVFGAERVVTDPYIQRLHNEQIKEILIVGFVVMLIFEAIILAIPEQIPRR